MNSKVTVTGKRQERHTNYTEHTHEPRGINMYLIANSVDYYL